MLIYFVESQNGDYYANQSSTENTSRNKSLISLKSVIKTLSSSHFINFKSNLSETNLTIEDLEAYYITIIKNLIRSLDAEKLSSYYNASQNEFPILEILLEYSHNTDIMIRNAARISLMWIFKNCHGGAMDYIMSFTIPKHSKDILKNLMKSVLGIQDFYETMNSKVLEKMYLSYKEELEYLDDISSLHSCIENQVTSMLLDYFIEPFIFKAIMTKHVIKQESPISSQVGLFLLSDILKTTRNITIKDYITSIILRDESIKSTQTNSVAEKKSNEAFISLKQILQKKDFDTEIICVLHILNILQINISEHYVKVVQFYCEFTLDMMNLFMPRNYFVDSNLNYIKLNLLTLILEPLAEKDEKNYRWLKIKKYVCEALRILYFSIGKQIRCEVPNLVSAIDKEYEVFIHLKININKFFEDINSLIKGDNRNFMTVLEPTKILLHSLFHVRHLYFKFQNRKENILPIIERKEKIGAIIQIDNCLPCKKLTHNNHYDNKHFLKFTDKQLLIAQATQIKSRGIVVFNSFYQDISWSVDINNFMRINELGYSNNFGKESKPLTLCLKFNNIDDMQMVIKFLLSARLNQVKIARMKLKELFHP